jgi:hypothetical protein
MRSLSPSLLFLLASTFTLAQTSPTQNGSHRGNDFNSPASPLQNQPTSTSVQTPATFPIPPANFGCPVGFSASRQAGGQVLTAGEEKSAGSPQGLHLTFDQRFEPAIQSIEVTVYASSGTPQALLLNLRHQGPESKDTVTKTFEFKRQTGAASLEEADVWMHEVGSIRWADLVSITFTDGTTWRPTEDLRCRAVPSNFVLVTSR